MALHTPTQNRIRKKRTEKHPFVWQIAKGVLRLFIIVFFLALTWYITRLPFFTISEVIVEGGETIPHDEVRAKVLQELQGAYVLLIPKQFSYLYPKERIEEVLRSNERMYGIAVTRLSRTKIQINFKEYVPHALWCAFERPDIPCYFITEKGYAFAEAPTLSGGAFVRHQQEGLTEITRGSAFTEEALHSLDAFIMRIMQERALRISSVVHRQNGDLELLINGGGMILVSGKKDFLEAFDNLTAVLTSEEFKHIEPGNFKYIDIRFDHKVFVNETLTETGSSTATSTEILPE